MKNRYYNSDEDRRVRLHKTDRRSKEKTVERALAQAHVIMDSRGRIGNFETK